MYTVNLWLIVGAAMTIAIKLCGSEVVALLRFIIEVRVPTYRLRNKLEVILARYIDDTNKS